MLYSGVYRPYTVDIYHFTYTDIGISNKLYNSIYISFIVKVWDCILYQRYISYIYILPGSSYGKFLWISIPWNYTLKIHTIHIAYTPSYIAC